MKQVEFYKSLANMEERECIEKFLIYNASLVISGVKPSATITIKKDKENLYDKWIKYGIDFLETIDIQYIDLRECSNALIILIYNEKQLSNYIFRKENKKVCCCNIGQPNIVFKENSSKERILLC